MRLTRPRSWDRSVSATACWHHVDISGGIGARVVVAVQLSCHPNDLTAQEHVYRLPLSATAEALGTWGHVRRPAVLPGWAGDGLGGRYLHLLMHAPAAESAASPRGAEKGKAQEPALRLQRPTQPQEWCSRFNMQVRTAGRPGWSDGCLQAAAEPSDQKIISVSVIAAAMAPPILRYAEKAPPLAALAVHRLSPKLECTLQAQADADVVLAFESG